MLKTLWYNSRWKRLIYDTGHYCNNFIQTIMKDRGRYGVEVTRLFGHFLDYVFFYKVFSYKLKLCKDCTREFNRVSGNWSVRVKTASDLFNLMYKLTRKILRKIPGRYSLNLPGRYQEDTH